MFIDLFPPTLGTQLTLLFLAFVLSASIGIERHWGMKSAGLRTHTLVGLGSALFTLVSAYGFATVLGADVQLDPSRIAAQIVSGIGFLGAGVIFVRRTVVSGLTTAASIWVTAAIGMACGAGMAVLAVAATALYFLTVGLLSTLMKRLPSVDRHPRFTVQYKEGRGILRDILAVSTELGYDASLAGTEYLDIPGKTPRVQADLVFHAAGRSPVSELVEALSDIKGVMSVQLMTRSGE